MSSKSVNHEDGGKGQVLMEGYLRKLKTMKKKYFVLRGESTEASARLEYYDNEKKYKAGQPPKRTISLKMCFNINRKMDTKHKNVIALYTKDDVFCIVLDSEKQQEDWLRLLLRLQSGGEDVVDGEPLRPSFEHIWKVKLQDKGLGDSKNLVGPYYVCLSDHTLSLVKITNEDGELDKLEFPLTQIRSCGGTESFFYIEVGRQSVTGAGELWMLTDDPNIAKNMNAVIQSAFTLRQNADPHRKRSCSATEMNRPSSMLQRRQTHGGGKPLLVSPYSGYSWNAGTPVGYGPAPPVVSISAPPPPDVCYDNVGSVVPLVSGLPRGPLLSAPRPASHRRHSVSAVSSCSTALAAARAASSDVPDGAEALATPAATIISHQRTKSCPVSDSSSNPLIIEPHRVRSQSHVSSPHSAEGDRRGSGTGFRRTIPHKSSTGTRERSDSMPSRNRTTSEGTHKVLVRPASMHMRGVSYSPPGPGSTDSAGSSLSIDEVELDRVPLAATPDDHTILEENTDDTLQWPQDTDLAAEKLDVYLPMSHPPTSLSLPIHQGRKTSAPGAFHGSPCGSSPSNMPDYLPMSPADHSRRMRPGTSPSCTSDYLPMSPSDSNRRREVTAGTSPSNTSDYLPLSPADSTRRVAGNSPSNHSDYLPMSPGESVCHGHGSMDYLPMSPAVVAQRGMHSRDGSLTEDGYVPMAPAHSDDGYVDMDPVPSHPFLHDDHHSDMSPGSSCSVTSGTPSSDHYLLEKVSAYFTPSEEEESSTGRPARTYSFGSQPLLEVMNAAEAARVRAFSMGTQQRPSAHKLSMRPVPAGKFPSAPHLCNSWSGASRQASHDPMADLMEIDFTKNRASRCKGVPMVENLAAQNNSSADSGYMDMSSKSPPRPSPPKAPSIKHLFSPPDAKTHGTRKPAIISSSALKTIGERPDIKPQMFPTTSSANLNILPNKHQAPEKPYVEMKGRASGNSDNRLEGYMEMTPGPNASKMARKVSTESMSDYLPMHGGKRGSDPSSDYLPMSCGKRSSQPIAILGPSSPIVRKGSSTTPPKPPNYLPVDSSSGSLSLFSSIRRNPKRKNRKKVERRDSKENVTTPTTIFPLSLNSPQSPKKVYSPASTSTSQPTDPAVESDSLNLAAPLSRVLRICSKENSVPSDAQPPDEGDYALMRPGVASTQRWTPVSRIPDDSVARSSASRLPVTPRPEKLQDPDGETRGKGPPPGGEAGCEPCRLHAAATAAANTTAESHSGVSRQVSTSSSSSTEVISVKEGTGGSTGVERDIAYASLDLGSEGEEPRSPRPSPAPSPAPTAPLSYAEIDFQKSESLRAPAQPLNRKIRH